ELLIGLRLLRHEREEYVGDLGALRERGEHLGVIRTGGVHRRLVDVLELDTEFPHCLDERRLEPLRIRRHFAPRVRYGRERLTDMLYERLVHSGRHLAQAVEVVPRKYETR